MESWGYEVIVVGDKDVDDLIGVFPPLAEVEWGLFGHGSKYPKGWHYEYLGMGNHLLVRDDLKERFEKTSDRLLKSRPDSILYNLWLKTVLSIL